MMKKNIKKIASFFMALTPCLLFGLDANNGVVSAETTSNMDIMLSVVTIILLLPLYLTTRTFLLVAKGVIEKKKTDALTANKVASLVLLLFLAQTGFAQTSDAVSKIPPSSAIFPDNPLTWILVIIIMVESFLIVYFSFLTNRLMKKPSEKTVPLSDACPEAITEKGYFKGLWDRMNSFKPLTEEGQIDTGHSYDGIRELNNITPPWFSTAFIGTIIIAAIYLYTHHISKTSPMQVDEYNMEMADAEKEKTKMLAIQGNNVDENSVTMLETADIESGKKIFGEKCMACHGANGGSMAGGVGPNLTDNYWLHGGSIKDIFKTIKYGWVEKGMISWKDQLSAKQIAQISSFIMSIQGSNPPGAKEAQGELYSEAIAPAVSKDSTATDSVPSKK